MLNVLHFDVIIHSMDKILPKPKNSRRNESKYTIEHPNHAKVLKSFVAYVRMRAEKKEKSTS